MIDKQTIKKNFSRSAPDYDQYCSVQNVCALGLIARLKRNGFSNILELGCGTGNYTQLLNQKFPQAKIKAVDISSEMIKMAREKTYQGGIDFIVADAEELSLKQRFNLISSNASLQWFENLAGTLSRYRDSLVKNGIISFSLFGPSTFFELNLSLQELSGKAGLINSYNFITKKKIEKILKGLFREVEVEQRIYKERYNSLSQLLKVIKYTGVRGSGSKKRIFWTSKLVADLERIYKKRFKDIIASYEAFFCKGVK